MRDCQTFYFLCVMDVNGINECNVDSKKTSFFFKDLNKLYFIVNGKVRCFRIQTALMKYFTEITTFSLISC